MTAPRFRTRPDLCPQAGHPGVTFNPNFGPNGRAWCLCGQVTHDGAPDFTAMIAAREQLRSPLGSCGGCGTVEGERHRYYCPDVTGSFV